MLIREIANGLLTIRLDRPERGNALGPDLVEALLALALTAFVSLSLIIGLLVRTVADRRLGIAPATEATTPTDPSGEPQRA